MTIKDNVQENFLCLIAGILVAIAFIAIMCGDGNRGIFDVL